jgi:hypothetical protein
VRRIPVRIIVHAMEPVHDYAAATHEVFNIARELNHCNMYREAVPPAYHSLMQAAIERGIHSSPWTEPSNSGSIRRR